MRVLFLAQRVPYPPVRGDKITTWKLVQHLGERHDLSIVSFAHDAADREAAAELERMGYDISTFPHDRKWAQLRSLPLLLTSKPLTLGVYGSRALQARVDELATTYDLGYAYSSSMGAFLLPHARMARVNHVAELDSDKWRQYAESQRFPMNWVYRREWRALAGFERELAEACELNVLCTPLEEQIFQREIPGPETRVLPNGVDLDAPARDAALAEPGHIVFVGVMDYLPNIDACVWFAREILPEVRERHPNARFSIVGSHPAPEVQALGELPGVEVTGWVDDPREWLQRAALSVAPLRIARGIQNKVLEAMSAGVPVVGTTSATQGVAAREGEHYLVADEKASMVDAVCGLLRDPVRAAELGTNARRYVEEHYRWERVLERLDTILEDASRKHSQKQR